MSQLPQNQHLADMAQIDDEIYVRWSTDNEYHHGIVTERLQSGLHRIFYEEDGIIEDVMLEHEQWCFKDPSCKGDIASQLVRSRGTSAPHPEEISQRAQDREISQEYEPQSDMELPIRRRAWRPRGKSGRSSSESADTPRRSPRLSIKGEGSIAYVRRSRRLSSKDVNIVSETIPQKATVSSADALVQDIGIETSRPRVSNTTQTCAIPCPARFSGTFGGGPLPPSILPTENLNDMTTVPRPDWKNSQEVLDAKVSITPESEGPLLGPKDSEQVISSALTKPHVNLECNTFPAKEMTTNINYSSAIPNASAPSASAPNASFSMSAWQSANEGRQNIPEPKGCHQKSDSGSDAQDSLLSVDSNAHDATRNGKKVLHRKNPMTQTGKRLSPNLRSYDSARAGQVNGVSSEPVMPIQNKRSGTNPLSQSKQDGIEITAYVPLSKKPKSLVIPPKLLSHSHSSFSSQESSNNGLESNFKTESDHRKSTLVEKPPRDPPMQEMVDQSPMKSRQVPSRRFPPANAIESGLRSALTSYLDSAVKNGSVSINIGSLPLDKTVLTGGLQPDDQKNVDNVAEEQKNTGPALIALEDMNVERNIGGRVKRTAAESLIVNKKKHQKRNSSIPFSPNIQANRPDSGTPQCTIAVNTVTHKGHATNDTSEIKSAGDAERAAVSAAAVSGSSNPDSEPKSDDRETCVASFTVTAHQELEKDIETPVSRTCILRSDTITEDQLEVAMQTSKSPSGALGTSTPAFSRKMGEYPVTCKEGVPRESVPALLTLKQQQRSSQGDVAGLVRTTAVATPVQTASRAVSKNGIDARPPIPSGKQHIQSCPTFQTSALQQQLNNRPEGTRLIRSNAGSSPTQPARGPVSRNEMSETRHILDVNAKRAFFQAIVRVEKEAADIDMNLRHLMGQGERRNKAIESLQERVGDAQKKIGKFATSEQVKSIMESRSCDMKQMLQESFGSVMASFRNEMRDYISREMKNSLETTASEIHRQTARMLSRAVEVELSSNSLEEAQLDDSPGEDRNEEEDKRD